MLKVRVLPVELPNHRNSCGGFLCAKFAWRNATPCVLDEPQILWGRADARIRNLTFENLTLGGKPVRKAEFFKTNEFVDGLIFKSSSTSNP